MSPPPPAKRGLISGVFLAAIFLIAAPPAEAQTARTYTFTATNNNGDRDLSTPQLEVIEGDTVTLTLTVSGLTSGFNFAEWNTVNFTGTATAGEDYPSGTFRGNLFDTTDAVRTLSSNYLITDDTAPEPDESIIVPVPVVTSSLDTFTTTSTEITITIVANDGHPDQPLEARTLTVTGPSTLTETDGNLETGNYTIALAGTAFPSATTVTWTVTNGTTTNADFVAASDRTGTVEFATTDTSQTFTLTIAGDDLNEAAERFSVQVSVANPAADGGTGYGAPATTTITDDDPITATLPTATVTAAESGTAAFMVNLTGGTATADVVITYNSADATGSLTIPTGMTTGMLELAAVNDEVSEGAEMLSLAAADFTASSAGAVTVAVSGAPTLTINADSDDDISVTIAAPAAANTGQAAEFTVRMSGASAAAVTVEYTVTLTVDGAPVTIPAGNITDTVSPIAAGARGGVISVRVPADVNVAESGSLSVELTGATANPDIGTVAVSTTMSENTATVGVSSDDPAARAARLEAPLASAGRGVGQLAARAVQQRLTAGASANSLTLAGRDFAGGTEILAAEYLAGGHETPAADLLRQSGFSLVHADSGLNFWGGGGHVSAKGDHAGIAYDGETTALHLGADTARNNGLLGIAIARSNSDMAFNNTDNLETEVTSVHPYLTRKFGEVQLWTTVGRGRGEAELKEPDTVIKTDVTVTTAALGAVYAPATGVSLSADGVYTRAQLDAAQSAGRRLPKVTADALRLNAAAELSGRRDAWRSFLTVKVRHDSGDGDTGAAGDVGGGVEWQKATASLRLAGATHLAGDGAEEDRLTLTLRKNAGRLNLGLNLGVNNGIDTANLLSGEWRF